MTAFELHKELAGRKSRGRLLGQPPDLQTVYVTTTEDVTMQRTIEAGAAVISRGGRLSDASEIFPLFGFAGLPPWMEAENASA